MIKRYAVALLALGLATAARADEAYAGRFAPPACHPAPVREPVPCGPGGHEVCERMPDKVKSVKTCYSMRKDKICKDVCSPRALFSRRDDCCCEGDLPCGKVRTRRRLVKILIPREKDTTKCVPVLKAIDCQPAPNPCHVPHYPGLVVPGQPLERLPHPPMPVKPMGKIQ